MTAAQCHRSAAKTRPPDATQKKPASGNQSPSSNYAKLSLAGEGRGEGVPAGEGPQEDGALSRPLPQASGRGEANPRLYQRPVEPKPPAPRSVEDSVAT